MDQVTLAHRAVVPRNRLADFEAGIRQPTITMFWGVSSCKTTLPSLPPWFFDLRTDHQGRLIPDLRNVLIALRAEAMLADAFTFDQTARAPTPSPNLWEKPHLADLFRARGRRADDQEGSRQRLGRICFDNVRPAPDPLARS
jgi:hypothetical protein